MSRRCAAVIGANVYPAEYYAPLLHCILISLLKFLYFDINDV